MSDIESTTNQSVFDQWENKDKDLYPDVILLNTNFHYVHKNIMIDCDQTFLSDESSFII